MSAARRLTVPYTGDMPVISVILDGPNGPHHVIGVVDSGADRSLLPYDVACELGIPQEDLKPTTDGSTGAGDAWFPTWELAYPLAAQVLALTNEPELWGPQFGLQPEFAKGTIALFGRADFFRAFTVTFEQHSNPSALFHLDTPARAGT